MAFKGITFAGQNVTPKDDGALYMAHYGDGILDGCSMALSGDDLVIQSGHIIAGGRVCHVDGATNVDLSGRQLSTGYIQVIMNYDLSQGEGSQWYTSFVESATTTFPALTTDDINGTGTLYQMELAVIQISGGNLTDIYRSVRYSMVIATCEDGDYATMSADGSGISFRGYDHNGDIIGGTSFFDVGGMSLFANASPIVIRPNGVTDNTGRTHFAPTGEVTFSGQIHGGLEYGTATDTHSGTTTGNTEIVSLNINSAGRYQVIGYLWFTNGTANTNPYSGFKANHTSDLAYATMPCINTGQKFQMISTVISGYSSVQIIVSSGVSGIRAVLHTIRIN